MKTNKSEKNISGISFAEYGILACVGLLMLAQRFLTGGYKPVMDDWFLYGDIYKTVSDRIAYFAVPNEKFAIRPAAGFFDCFINAPMFERLWVIELILTLSLLAGAFLIMLAVRKNKASGAGLFMCLVCLFPVGLEATYWIAAATRVSYSVLFIGAAVYSLDYYYKTKKPRGIILYSVLGFICVGFYEPAVVMYIILTLFIVWCGSKEKKDLAPLLIMAAHIAAIGVYYILNSGAGEIESRGGFVGDGFAEHTSLVGGYIYDIFTKHTKTILVNGWSKGLAAVLDGHGFIKLGFIAVISLLLGLFSSFAVKKRGASPRILLLGAALFIGGLSLNFILDSDRITLRLVYFSYFGAGIIIEELIALLPSAAGKPLRAAAAAFSAFVFTIAGIGGVSDYQKTSGFDLQITKQLIALDTEHNITNPDKNTYIFGGQHYYEECSGAAYLDNIRGASGNYADITGCMRHLTGIAQTNNLLTFTYGDSHVMKPYIDTEGLCSFYNIEYDKTVTRVTLVPDGDNYRVVRGDNSVAGTLQTTDGINYRFFN